MSKIKSFIDFTGLSELARVAIRELFPNFGKNEVLIVYVYDHRYSENLKNFKR